MLAGGLFGAFVGPQLVILTKEIWPPYLFAASYLAQAGVAILAAIVLAFVDIPRPVLRGERAQGARPTAAASDRTLGAPHNPGVGRDKSIAGVPSQLGLYTENAHVI